MRWAAYVMMMHDDVMNLNRHCTYPGGCAGHGWEMVLGTGM